MIRKWTASICCPFPLYNGLPVCAIRERVNRYTVSLSYMLTCSDYYGNMVSVRKRLRTALEPGEPGPQ